MRDCHMRVKRVALEHHGDIAVSRIGRCDVLAVDENPARGRRVEVQARILKVVLLPEPDGPSNAKNSAGLISKLTPFSAANSPCILTIPEFDPTLTAQRRPPPLTAPTVNPLMMCFCATMPSTTTGSIARTETAASLAHKVCSTDTKLNIATVTGRTVLPLSTTANRNSFQALRNAEDDGHGDASPDLGYDNSPQGA